MTTNDKEIPPCSFSFGLACIDSLIDPDHLSYAVADSKPVVACIVGPDGVGKSILGLSAASMYAAENANSKSTRVIYVSTDLNSTQAKTTWENFGLGRPKQRREEIRSTIEELLLAQSDVEKLKKRDNKLEDQCDLQWLCPFPIEIRSIKQKNGPESFSEIFKPKEHVKAVVQFLDLAEFSAGDDWGLLNRIIGLLTCIANECSENEREKTTKAPHLLVIDAVEGLETMAGNLDAFGLRRSRRSRLAQLVRIARKANCSILFVIEEKSADLKLDEVFISDLVLRLSVSERDGYLQKSIEIEKARSVGHVRGSHELQIRDGKGGIGDPTIPDDPVLKLQGEFLGYIQIWPSLHHKTKPQGRKNQSKSKIDRNRIQNQSLSPPTVDSIEELPPWFKDDQLNRWINQQPNGKTASHQDRIVVSIGEAGTMKSRLAFDFLAQPFREQSLAKRSGAILITSENNSLNDLKKAIGETNLKFNDNQILVRQIQPRFLSSSGFLYRIKFCIEQMKKNLRALDDKPVLKPSDIRLVIDNWNTILETHPSIARDPQIMHRVFQLIREENILAHIVSTQPGSPSNSSRANRANNIAQVEAIHLHTWPVDFFGDRRIAITSSVPGSAERRSTIYELIREEGNPEYGFKVSEDFDIYEDLETGKARRVDLRVKLYGGFDSKLDQKNNTAEGYSSEVSALFGDLYPNSKNNRDVVSFESVERYSAFKDYIQSMEFAKLDETLVFQVDEFWNSGNSKESSNLANLDDYLNKIPKDALKLNIANKDFFESGIVSQGGCKVPLHKDFGLILADRESWYKAQDREIEYVWREIEVACKKRLYPAIYIGDLDFDSIPMMELVNVAKSISNGPFVSVELADRSEKKIKIKDVWNALCIKGDELGGIDTRDADKQFSPSWSVFLQACRVVASHCGKHPYDIDIRTSESLNSQILETWFSAIFFQEFFDKYNHILSSNRSFSSSENELLYHEIAEFLHESIPIDLGKFIDKYGAELRYSVEMISEYMPARLRKDGSPATPPDENSVAFRTWFAPAVLSQKNRPILTPLRLPGRFSTRGDWHVGVAKGSRSLLLAHSAIDKLTSESMNRRRLRDGVGLPTRKSPSLDTVESALTVPTQVNSRRRLRYSEIRNFLEPRLHLKDPADGSDRPELLAIFRSKIRNYDVMSSELFSMFQELLRISLPQPGELEVRKSQEGIRGQYGGQARWEYPGQLMTQPTLLVKNFCELAKTFPT